MMKVELLMAELKCQCAWSRAMITKSGSEPSLRPGEYQSYHGHVVRQKAQTKDWIQLRENIGEARSVKFPGKDD